MTASFFSTSSRRLLGACIVSLSRGLSTVLALPLGATCEIQNCDPGLICKNSNGQNVPPSAGPGTCVVRCDNDGFCDSGETVQHCPSDCHCGNGICEPSAPWSENKANCGQDCYCGNGSVEVGENNCTCPADVSLTTCGDGCCRGSETTQSCVADCGTPLGCGNGNIDSGETFCTCPVDVQSTTCGDGCCVGAQGETISSCYQDCGSCGDGVCTAPESVGSCPSDCHVCGDGVCTAPWENGNNCVDCKITSCTISGPQICRNNTYTFDCNHYSTTGTITMSNINPNQTSQSDSLTVSFGATDQGVTTLACFNNGIQLCATSRAIGYCGDAVTNCNEQCDYGNSFPDACNSLTCTREACTQQSDCGGFFVCNNGVCGLPTGQIANDGSCDPTTQYASGVVSGWICPEGRVLQGCPGAYMCARRTFAPIICTECGNLVKDPTEECDRSDPVDPHRDACNQNCLLNYCGDGEVSVGTSTGFVRNRTASGAVTTRSTLAFSRIISQGQGGMQTILESGSGHGSFLGAQLSVLNDIDEDGFAELAASAPGHDVGGQGDHGQLFSLSFDTGGRIDTVRAYFSGLMLTGATQIGNLLTTIGDIDTSIFGAGQFPLHREFIFTASGSTDRLISLFVGKHPTYVGQNSGYVLLTPASFSSIIELMTVGDVDGNGVQDIVVAYREGAEVRLAVMLLAGSPAMRLSTQIITGIGFSATDRIKMSPLGDSDGDGVPDILISGYNPATGLMSIKRLTIQSNGALKNQSSIYAVTLPGAENAFAIYGDDVDEDGVKDIVTFRNKKSPYISDGLLLLMQSNRSIKSSYLLDFGVYKVPGDDAYFPHSAIFLPDFDNDGDETLAIGSPTSFTYKGAIYTHELQAPYGHALTVDETEECDAGSFCDDLVTRCEDNPSLCPGGPARCQPRYLNGCTPFCQLGCGDGVIDAGGLDGIIGTIDDEQCDDGNGDNTDGCTNMCKRPFCGDEILTVSSNWTGQNGEYPGGYFEQCDPTTISQNYGICQNDCTLTGSINALCNFSFAASIAYNANDTADFLAKAQAANKSLCYPRIPGVLQSLTGLVDPNTGITTGWSRICQGQEGGQTAACLLPRRACGDGVLDVWSGHQNIEECDDGNTVQGDGCDATCKREAPLIPEVINQCTVGTYPQVEEGEYLPVWRLGEWSQQVQLPGTGINCSAYTDNKIIRESIMCTIQIQRGDAILGTVTVATQQVPCATISLTGAGLITGALTDFASGFSMDQILGTYIFATGQVASWVNTGSGPQYGQYRMSVNSLAMEYCALRRTSVSGTVTGEVTTASNFESCTNNVDDNGNGYVDCADVLCQNYSLHPQCHPSRGVSVGGEVCTRPQQVACSSIQDGLHCDQGGVCRSAQRAALGMVVNCYEKLIARNINNPSQQCSKLFGGTEAGCTNIPGCELPINPASPNATYNGPIYIGTGMPPMGVVSTSTTAFQQLSYQLRASAIQLSISNLQNKLQNISTVIPGQTSIILEPLHVEWIQQWFAEGQANPTPPITFPQPEVVNAICGGGGTGGFSSCSLGMCASGSTLCLPGPVGLNEHCSDGVDNDNDTKIDRDDPDCYQFYGTGYQVPQLIGNRTSGPVNYTATGAMCEAGFSVSKGYFVQKGFSFSEQANTGLDIANFTSIEGISLVAEGTAIDDSLNQVATYQGAGKKYLFDNFIDTWKTKAVNDASVSININGVTRSYVFKKVPSQHIYYFEGGANVNVLLNTDVKNAILREGGVSPGLEGTTPFTFVIPETAQKLTIEGSMLGNGLFISKGNIRFASSADLGCDGSDIVEGLFVAGGNFETDTIGNRNLNQQTWCKGGNLQIKGTLLGMNAGSQLAPLRRSVLNAWSSGSSGSTGSLLFDDSKIFKAKELFENCYLPALLSTKANSINSVFTKYTNTISGCRADTLWSETRATVKATVKDIGDTLLSNITNYILQPGLSCSASCSVTGSNFILSMMDQGQANSSIFLVPSTITIQKPNGTTLTITVQQNTEPGSLLYSMQQQNKLFPARWFEGDRYNAATKAVYINLTNPIDLKEMLEDLGKTVEPIRQQFLSFPLTGGLAVTNNSTAFAPSLNTSMPATLLYKLHQIWGVSYLNNNTTAFVPGSCNDCIMSTSSLGKCKGGSYNNFICLPDMQFLRSNRSVALDENIARQEQVIEGSSVVILSNPTTWTDLPPGASDFLNSLVVVPFR